jgi:hypothetical protein
LTRKNRSTRSGFDPAPFCRPAETGIQATLGRRLDARFRCISLDPERDNASDLAYMTAMSRLASFRFSVAPMMDWTESQ